MDNNTANGIDDQQRDENGDEIKDFVKVGRTGRRNAISNIASDPNLNLTTVNITELMMKINCNNNNKNDKNDDYENETHNREKNDEPKK
jgi:hypothetical protein